MKLIIAGGRDFNDANLLQCETFKFIQDRLVAREGVLKDIVVEGLPYTLKSPAAI